MTRDMAIGLRVPATYSGERSGGEASWGEGDPGLRGRSQVQLDVHFLAGCRGTGHLDFDLRGAEGDFANFDGFAVLVFVLVLIGSISAHACRKQ